MCLGFGFCVTCHDSSITACCGGGDIGRQLGYAAHCLFSLPASDRNLPVQDCHASTSREAFVQLAKYMNTIKASARKNKGKNCLPVYAQDTRTSHPTQDHPVSWRASPIPPTPPLFPRSPPRASIICSTASSTSWTGVAVATSRPRMHGQTV